MTYWILTGQDQHAALPDFQHAKLSAQRDACSNQQRDGSLTSAGMGS
jgi:hypothetical protein